MASIKNIPYGMNANYETVIKIIGSKYVRYLVEKPDRTLSPDHTRQKHGNPPGLNKPPCQGLNDEQKHKGEKEEHKSQQAKTHNGQFMDTKGLKLPNTHCVSVPCGDKSSSYMHTLQRPSIGDQTLRQHESQQDAIHKPIETYEENDSLLTFLRKELGPYSLRLTTLEELQEACKVLDPRVSGLLPQTQLSHLLLKHEIPLQLPTVKLLFKTFATANEQELVNYEKLVHCLTLVAASKMQHSQVLAEKSQNSKNHSESSWTPEYVFQVLKQILKEQKEELDLGKLSLSFLQQDESCSGLFSQSETRLICKKHKLTLPPGILEALVSTYDIGRRGRIRWKTFVEFLKEVQDGIDPSMLVYRRGRKEKNKDDLQMDKGEHNLLTAKSWKQEKSGALDSSDSEEHDAWIDRFRKLEKALYLSDVKNTGKLNREKAKRLIHNYNQIYDLSLSPLKIDKAFQHSRPGQDMPLEPLLHYLKEL
ncbi:uncharacterized protein C1orf87 homolog isoform X2 [Eublepharis macularius]|uniref:Uncharacterized protein C1orf87 homolog isoform X2 n=1 Tax=Eublepharis macularius TaxID=481883 RepID=A0AA97JG99_EUBMA|nr:uncharacterized protein C1orf87 homolog isoform X2 [Eublepharis macularius]